LSSAGLLQYCSKCRLPIIREVSPIGQESSAALDIKTPHHHVHVATSSDSFSYNPIISVPLCASRNKYRPLWRARAGGRIAISCLKSLGTGKNDFFNLKSAFSGEYHLKRRPVQTGSNNLRSNALRAAQAGVFSHAALVKLKETCHLI